MAFSITKVILANVMFAFFWVTIKLACLKNELKHSLFWVTVDVSVSRNECGALQIIAHSAVQSCGSSVILHFGVGEHVH
jgi:hypothetical protein